jgi:hypothetical protein
VISRFDRQSEREYPHDRNLSYGIMRLKTFLLLGSGMMACAVLFVFAITI